MSKAKTRRIGTHAMISLCPWTAQSISCNRPCYKEQFYGIPSHRCIQMTPWSVNCNHNCIHCWRLPDRKLKVEDILSAEELVKMTIQQQRQLIAGFAGNALSDKKKAYESREPLNVAMSLTGEAWMYPYIDELIKLFQERGLSTTLVTAGGINNKILTLSNMPSMLYLSAIGYDQTSYEELNRPICGNWEKHIEFCQEFGHLKTNRVLRLTIMRNINDHKRACDGFAEIVKYTKPHYIEVRSLAPVARAAKLGRDKVLKLYEILNFCESLSQLTSYYVYQKNENSNVVLLIAKI
jgi:tRNA wybutosine-synthesizing protein 1